MTNGWDMLLSTVILTFRKQMAILTITQRQEMKCIFGHISLGEVAWSLWFLMEVQLGQSVVFLAEEVRDK